jgi:hypothetical protein
MLSDLQSGPVVHIPANRNIGWKGGTRCCFGKSIRPAGGPASLTGAFAIGRQSQMPAGGKR